MTHTPSVAVLLPCHQEEEHLPALLGTLLPQLEAHPEWRLVAMDDASTDGTGALLDAVADHPQVTVHHVRFRAPGATRSAAAASVTVLSHKSPPDWLLTLDCDVRLPDGFVRGWAERFAEIDDDERIGAVNGMEEQAHLLAGFPNARRASAVFGVVANRCEAAVGVVNLNGVNHAVRTSAYLTCGPYLQPLELGMSGPVNLAGEDWDLGLRLRVAGYDVAECPVSVRDEGRRMLADLNAYLSGTAYEGEFARITAEGAPCDLEPHTAASLAEPTTSRVLLHFFFKAVLARPCLLDNPIGLPDEQVAAMRSWIDRWPSPTFAESRNGFIHGRLPRFARAFETPVRQALRLTAAEIALAVDRLTHV